MKRVFINKDNLEIEDLDYEVVRVKGLIVNSKNEILIANNNNTYQFPGGHMEQDEDMEETLIREIKEETGIDISDFNGPFMEIMTYAKNYFNSDKNVCSKIYYYKINTDDLPNIDETNYDELERQTEFGMFYIPISDLEKFLNESILNNTIDREIGHEMLLVMEEYNNLFGGDK